MSKPKLSANALSFLGGHSSTQDPQGTQVTSEPTRTAQEPLESPQATQTSTMSKETTESRLMALQAEVETLRKLAHEEAVRKARYPWENPDIIQAQARLGYNFKIDPELYLKIQWLMENKGGFRSIQAFLDKAAKTYADELLSELGAK